MLKYIFVIAACVGLFSCRKNSAGPAAGPGVNENGLYVLSLGAAGMYADSGTLSFYSFGSRKLTPKVYSAANVSSQGLGDVDMGIYGTKMYVLLNYSSLVSVLDAKTGNLIKQISLSAPRKLTFANGNVYVGAVDAQSNGQVSIIDTLSLSVKATILLPDHFYAIEGMAAVNNKVYVSYPGLGGDVSDIVYSIDAMTNQLLKTIHVIPAPGNIAADSYGNVYVVSNFTDDWQMYNLSYGGMTIIDSKTDTVKTSFPSTGNNFAPMAVGGDLVYYTINNNIAVFNAKTQTVASTNFVTDGTAVGSPSSICVNPTTGEVYMTGYDENLSNGVIYVFDKTGKLEYSFPVAGAPMKLLLVN